MTSANSTSRACSVRRLKRLLGALGTKVFAFRQSIFGSLVFGVFLIGTSCGRNGANHEEFEQKMGVTLGHKVGDYGTPTGNQISESVAGVFSIEDNSLCTGVILDNQFVLTAAHCLGSRMVILFGNSLNNDSNFRRVIDYAVTPEWEAYKEGVGPLGGDLLLLRFDGGLPNGYRRALLLQSLPLPKENDRTMIAGYGLTDPQNFQSQGVLNWGIATISEIPFNNHEFKVKQNIESGACEGDSGGPAFIEYNSEPFVWGIVSRPSPEDDQTCNKYGVFTILPDYISWIHDEMKKMASKPMPSAPPISGNTDSHDNNDQDANHPQPEPTPEKPQPINPLPDE